MPNSFNAQSILNVGRDYEIYRLDAVPGSERLPFSIKILLENLLRNEDGVTVTRDDIQASSPTGTPRRSPPRRSSTARRGC